MIFLKKYISEFDISTKISNGNSKQMIICPNCKEKNVVMMRNKLTFSKIKTINCINCKRSIYLGNIFNFKTGSKLNNINTHHNQQTLDDYIWRNNYDKI